MSEHSPSRLARLSAEFAVIVVGVLVALFAESWWSERDDRRFEAELREDMLEEFQANVEILEADMAENERAAVALGAWVDRSEAEVLSLPDSVFQRWADDPSGSFAGAAFDPMMGNVQAVIQSGNLAAITDRDLRLLLSRWSGLLDEKTRFTQQAVTRHSDFVLPTAAGSGADREWTEEERREFMTLLRMLQDSHRLVIRNLGSLHEAATGIIEYLES